MTQSRDEWKHRYGQMDERRIEAEARSSTAESILRMLVEAASADKLEDFSRTSNVADMAADFLRGVSSVRAIMKGDRDLIVAQVGRDCCQGNDPACANECLFERAVKKLASAPSHVAPQVVDAARHDEVPAPAVAAPSSTRQIDEHTAMLLAAISTASIQNTRATAKQRIGRDNPYWTQAYADVCTAVDREMALRESAVSATRQEFPAELYDGVNVYAEAVKIGNDLKPKHVSAVLDAVVRLMRKNRSVDGGTKEKT